MKDTENIQGYRSHLGQTFESLDQLADYFGDVFDCPITIEDANHYVIAYSKHREHVDQARVATIMNRKVPDKVINGLWKKGVMPKLIDSDEPVLIPEIKEIGLGNRVAISIWKRNEILGFIWTHTGDKTLSTDELALLKEAAKQVKNLLLKNHRGKRNHEEKYKDFFWQLLTGNITDTKEIKQQAGQFNVKLEGQLAIVVFKFSDDVTEQMEKHAYYLAETQTQVKVVFRLFDENDFILLIRLIKNDDPSTRIYEFIAQFTEKISKQLNLTEVNGSSSLLYESAAHVKKAYKEAIHTIYLRSIFSNELKNTLLYEDLGIYQFIDDLYAIWKKQDYNNKYIQRLRVYDKKNQSSLLLTLDHFLHADSNVNHAAKQLFIHPNTMNYRLKRIKEVSGLDLKDPKQKTAVYLELILENM